jgi:hypothetical protein
VTMDMSPLLEKEMRLYFKGLKREMASAAARGEARVKTGKTPLSFEFTRSCVNVRFGTHQRT